MLVNVKYTYTIGCQGWKGEKLFEVSDNTTASEMQEKVKSYLEYKHSNKGKNIVIKKMEKLETPIKL